MCRERGKCKSAGVAWSWSLFIQGQEVNGSTAPRARRSYQEKKEKKKEIKYLPGERNANWQIKHAAPLLSFQQFQDKKSQSRMGNRSDGANLTPVQSRRGRVLPAAPQGTAALRALPLVFHILFQLRSRWMYRGCHACSDGVGALCLGSLQPGWFAPSHSWLLYAQ